MNKQELKTALGAKKGFVRIIEDTLAPDSIPTDPMQKRYFTVEHVNTDGTAGITYVYYLQDTGSNNNEDLQACKYYNTEPANFDNNEPTAEAKKQTLLEDYLNTKYDAWFLNRVDLQNNWAEADVYKYNATTKVLDKKTVVVYKKGTSPIADVQVNTI